MAEKERTVTAAEADESLEFLRGHTCWLKVEGYMGRSLNVGRAVQTLTAYVLGAGSGAGANPQAASAPTATEPAPVPQGPKKVKHMVATVKVKHPTEEDVAEAVSLAVGKVRDGCGGDFEIVGVTSFMVQTIGSDWHTFVVVTGRAL